MSGASFFKTETKKERKLFLKLAAEDIAKAMETNQPIAVIYDPSLHQSYLHGDGKARVVTGTDIYDMRRIRS